MNNLFGYGMFAGVRKFSKKIGRQLQNSANPNNSLHFLKISAKIRQNLILSFRSIYSLPTSDRKLSSKLSTKYTIGKNYFSKSKAY